MFPFRRTHQADGDSSVRPEEVLLQITLAFTVVLGFLLSAERAFKAELGHRLVRMEQAYEGLKRTPIGEAVEQRNQAKVAEERWRLLYEWINIRSNHDLFRYDSSRYIDGAVLVADGAIVVRPEVKHLVIWNVGTMDFRRTR